MKKTDIRVKRTYRQLYQALIELLAEKSFDEITIIEICTKAEIHRATFYKHFVDKYDFLHTCLKMKLEELSFEPEETKYKAETVKTSCMMMVNRILDFVVENMNLLKRVKQNEYSCTFNTVLTECVSDFLTSRLKSLTDISDKLGDNIYMDSHFYSGAIVNLIRWWIDGENNLKKEDIMNYAELKIDDLCRQFDKLITN